MTDPMDPAVETASTATTEPTGAASAGDTTQPNVIRQAKCPDCGVSAGIADRFCEACGRELGVRRVALPQPDSDTTPTCAGCGGAGYDADGYCPGCGQLRSEPDRAEADLAAVAVVTDRGIAHARNEDSVAAAVLYGPTIGHPIASVIAVSDGVSTSEDPQAASGAATRAGVDAGLSALADGESAHDAVMAGLVAASLAVRAVAVDESHAPSCTYVGAVVRGYENGAVEITVANVGDSRAYWLRADGVESIGEGNPISQRLSTDDSWAQALVDAGAMDEESAMRDPRAHMLLRWLGADTDLKPWSSDCVRTLRTTGPGVLLLCSDGLWNYQPDTQTLARMVTGVAPMSAARGLVEFALRCGGGDNITVALAPIGLRGEPGEPG